MAECCDELRRSIADRIIVGRGNGIFAIGSDFRFDWSDDELIESIVEQVEIAFCPFCGHQLKTEILQCKGQS